MHNKIYIKDLKQICFFREKATADFWDRHWKVDDLRKTITSADSDAWFIPAVKKYLPKGSLVLEGGCGRGNLVWALRQNGYKGIGIDFATKTVEQVNQAAPEIDIRHGDVFNLKEFPDAHFDGYISGGVIEHFWDGNQGILSEMSRVIKPGGLLFITFPTMSLLRRFKALVGAYPAFTAKEELQDRAENFYQFALDSKSVIKSLEQYGFELISKSPVDGIKGFKDETSILHNFLQGLYDGKIYFHKYITYGIKLVLNSLFKHFASHMHFLILKRKDNN